MIDPTFRNVNRLFALSFKNVDNDPTRDSFDKFNMPLVEIRDFNALIGNKPFFDIPIKINRKRMKNLLKCQEMVTVQQANYYIIYYHQDNYKLIGIDLLKQVNTSIHQQVNFTGKLEEDDSVTMFFTAGKQQKTILNFSLDSLNVTE